MDESDENDESDERESECANGFETNSMFLLEYSCGTNRVEWGTLSF